MEGSIEGIGPATPPAPPLPAQQTQAPEAAPSKEEPLPPTQEDTGKNLDLYV